MPGEEGRVLVIFRTVLGLVFLPSLILSWNLSSDLHIWCISQTEKIFTYAARIRKYSYWCGKLYEYYVFLYTWIVISWFLIHYTYVSMLHNFNENFDKEIFSEFSIHTTMLCHSANICFIQIQVINNVVQNDKQYKNIARGWWICE